MAKILFNLEDASNEKLKALADRWETSKSNIIRYALRRLLNQHEIRTWDPQYYNACEETIEIAKTKWIEED